VASALSPGRTDILLYPGRIPGLLVWDLGNSQWRLAPPSRLSAESRPFRNGRQFVDAGPKGFPEVWDGASGQTVFSLESEALKLGFYPHGMALSADDTWLAQNALAPGIWDLESRKLLLILPEERTTRSHFAWSPNKDLLAVSAPSGQLVIWNLPRMRSELAKIGLDW
jgi:WD40 repeat protein